ncbi:MAG: sugar transferase [Burkholderiaceae bacterium]|nr:sugar transferase [Burkholderiaceae bacterium]
MTKRMFDLVVATVALLAMAPILLLAMLAIRIDSPGPAAFRQERVGRGGRVFRIHKLRTMFVDASARGPAVTAHDDARVTRVGRVLRHYRIDELPQLIDVIKGDMSLVGPRPEVPCFVAAYPPALRDELLAVRPGLTDPAALEFANEAAELAEAADPERMYIERILPRKLQLQADYLRRATLGSDLAVLGRTLKLLLAR